MQKKSPDLYSGIGTRMTESPKVHYENAKIDQILAELEAGE